jgi:glycosyltransferase involved in cell wall biosynthesis
MLRLGERLAVRYAHHVIVVSDVLLAEIGRKYPKQKQITYIPNGVQPHRPEENKGETKEVLKQWGLVPQNYLLAVGRIVEEKGFDLLAKAFTEVAPKFLKLVIVGGFARHDSYIDKLHTICRKDDRIILTGAVMPEKLVHLYLQARLFVLPSSHEGLPIVLLEAMAYKCPVLVSNIAAHTAMRLPKECYFNSQDPEGLKLALQKRLAKGALKRVNYEMAAYNWRTIASKTKRIYEELCHASTDNFPENYRNLIGRD